MARDDTRRRHSLTARWSAHAAQDFERLSHIMTAPRARILHSMVKGRCARNRGAESAGKWSARGVLASKGA